MSQVVGRDVCFEETDSFAYWRGVASPTERGWKATLDNFYELSRAGDWGSFNDGCENLPIQSNEEIVLNIKASFYGPRLDSDGFSEE